jgi:hypothetical protein
LTLPSFQDYVEAAIGGANRTGGGSGIPLSAAELKRRTEKLSQAMHSLPFLFKFVVKSRLLFAALNGGKGTEPFEAGLEKTQPSGFFLGFLGFFNIAQKREFLGFVHFQEYF